MHDGNVLHDPLPLLSFIHFVLAFHIVRATFDVM